MESFWCSTSLAIVWRGYDPVVPGRRIIRSATDEVEHFNKFNFESNSHSQCTEKCRYSAFRLSC
jgi:hypothetical protein